MIDTEQQISTTNVGCQQSSANKSKTIVTPTSSNLPDARTFILAKSATPSSSTSSSSTALTTVNITQQDDDEDDRRLRQSKKEANDLNLNLIKSLPVVNHQLTISENSESNSSSSAWRRIDQQKLSVVLPTSGANLTQSGQKTLATPTISIASECHLIGTGNGVHRTAATASPNVVPTSGAQSILSTLEVDGAGRFDGVPSCTPISADRLLSIGLTEMNPFFRNVNSHHPQSANITSHASNSHTSEAQLPADLNANKTNITCASSTATTVTTSAVSSNNQTLEQQQQQQQQHQQRDGRSQLPKLNFNSAQLQAAMSQMLSPYLMATTTSGLSPEQEAWLRSFPSPQQQMHQINHHPLAGHEFMMDTQTCMANQQPTLTGFRPQDLTAKQHQQICIINGAQNQHQTINQQQQQQHQHSQQQQISINNQFNDSQQVQFHQQTINSNNNNCKPQQQISSNQIYLNPGAQISAQFNANAHMMVNHPFSQQVSPTNPTVQLTTYHHHHQDQALANEQHQHQLHHHQQQQSNNLARGQVKENPAIGSQVAPPLAHYNADTNHQLQLQHQINQLSPNALSALHYDTGNGQPQLSFYDPQIRNFYMVQHDQHQIQMQQQTGNTICHPDLIANNQKTLRQHQQQQQQRHQIQDDKPTNQLSAIRTQPVPKTVNIRRSVSSLSGHSSSLTGGSSSATPSDRVSPSSSRILSVSPAASNSHEPIQVDVEVPINGGGDAITSSLSETATTTTTSSTSKSSTRVLPTQTPPNLNKSKKSKSKISSQNSNNNNNNIEQLSNANQTLTGDGLNVVKKKSKGGRKKKLITHDELIARKNRSKERNRVAAKRCRQKRKQFLDELRDKIDELNELNNKLQKENNTLKREMDLIKLQKIIT